MKSKPDLYLFFLWLFSFRVNLKSSCDASSLGRSSNISKHCRHSCKSQSILISRQDHKWAPLNKFQCLTCVPLRQDYYIVMMTIWNWLERGILILGQSSWGASKEILLPHLCLIRLQSHSCWLGCGRPAESQHALNGNTFQPTFYLRSECNLRFPKPFFIAARTLRCYLCLYLLCNVHVASVESQGEAQATRLFILLRMPWKG